MGAVCVMSLSFISNQKVEMHCIALVLCSGDQVIFFLLVYCLFNVVYLCRRFVLFVFIYGCHFLSGAVKQ